MTNVLKNIAGIELEGPATYVDQTVTCTKCNKSVVWEHEHRDYPLLCARGTKETKVGYRWEAHCPRCGYTTWEVTKIVPSKNQNEDINAWRHTKSYK